MNRGPLLSFESSAFPVTPGEDEETNPGIYGRELASWISEQLRAVGLHAGSVIPGMMRVVACRTICNHHGDLIVPADGHELEIV